MGRRATGRSAGRASHEVKASRSDRTPLLLDADPERLKPKGDDEEGEVNPPVFPGAFDGDPNDAELEPSGGIPHRMGRAAKDGGIRWCLVMRTSVYCGLLLCFAHKLVGTRCSNDIS